ncbi:MAG: hypothetical protein GVY19_13760 [Bacteroidetes bacterium]|nr:hypothetical protein [Bacteroidota bacterium]
MKKNIGIFLFIAFTSLMSLNAYSQENDIIEIKTEKLTDDITKVSIILSAPATSAESLEVYKGTGKNTLVKKIKLSETSNTKYEYEFTGNEVYTIFLKNSSGKVIAAEAVVTK